MKARMSVFQRVIEAKARTEVVGVSSSLPVQKRQDQRIELTCAADVFYIGIQFVPQANIQREPRANTPIVLHEARKVCAIGVGNQQWLSGLTAAYGYRKQQIVIINLAIAVAIEVRKVFDHLNAPLLKDPQIKISVDALYLTSKVQRVSASDHRERIAELQSSLFGALRYTERGAVLNAGKRQLRSGGNGLDVVKERAETKIETIHIAGI